MMQQESAGHAMVDQRLKILELIKALVEATRR